MSVFARRRHEGRLKDAHQVPDKRRSVFILKFHFLSKDPVTEKTIPGFFGCKCAVFPPHMENLNKLKREYLDANDSWWKEVRVAGPDGKPVILGTIKGKPIYKTKKICLIRKITADFVGVDK